MAEFRRGLTCGALYFLGFVAVPLVPRTVAEYWLVHAAEAEQRGEPQEALRQLRHELGQLLTQLQADVRGLHEQVRGLEARLEALEIAQATHMLAVDTADVDIEDEPDDTVGEELDRMFDADHRRN